MTRAVFPLVPDPDDARPLQSPTADEIARIRAALPTGTPIMKGKWESMDTAPRDGRPVWCRDEYNFESPYWAYRFPETWNWTDAVTRGEVDPYQWFNPEASP